MSWENILPLLWIPWLTAFIGWLTNWLAIRMLFRPREPVGILGLRWQGLIPHRRIELAEKVADIVQNELLTKHVIRQELDRLDVHGYVDGFIHNLVQDRLRAKLKSIPLFGMIAGTGLINTLEKVARDAVHEEIEPLRQRLADDLESHLQIRELVLARIATFEMWQLEEVVNRVAAREFRFIEWLGAGLGFIIGGVQVVILALM